MTPAQSVAFQAGSGITPGTLLTGIAGVVLLLAFVWVIWVTLGTFRAWQDGQVGVFDLTWGALRASIVLLVLGFYLNRLGRRGGLEARRVFGLGDDPRHVVNRGRPQDPGEQAMRLKGIKRKVAAIGLLGMTAVPSVWAALPTPVAPSTAPAAGDWIALIKGYIKDGGLVLGLAIAVLGFLWIAYLGFAKFNEARQGKAEWAEVGVLGIVGAIVLFVAYFLITNPEGAASLVLIVDDPDAPDPEAPRMVWVHWVLYELPPSATGLGEEVSSSERPQGTLQGLNDWKRPGYGGPCPPDGEHRYRFRLYALDCELDLPDGATKAELRRAMDGHVLAEALRSTYEAELGDATRVANLRGADYYH
mgnify:CR=1 FL=1